MTKPGGLGQFMPMVLFGSGINGSTLIKVWFSLVSDGK
jgi:hypothetical protein